MVGGWWIITFDCQGRVRFENVERVAQGFDKGLVLKVIQREKGFLN